MYVAMYLRKSRAEELSDSLEETLQKHRRRLEALAQVKLRREEAAASHDYRVRQP